jgi:hypothetical protein
MFNDKPLVYAWTYRDVEGKTLFASGLIGLVVMARRKAA